jgi:guanylate kinase
VPHQPVEDGRGPVRSPARRAGQPLQDLTGTPKLFVVTGPSGAGKGTLIRALLERRDDLEVAISATTRPQRPGEEDGREYYFLSEAEFLARKAADEFLEEVTYVSGQRYGTLNAEVDRIRGEGKSCVLELETQGAKDVEGKQPDAVSIFITAPISELERRLRARDTESAGEIGERLELARRQLEEADDFDYVVQNDDVRRAVEELQEIVRRSIGAPATLRER